MSKKLLIHGWYGYGNLGDDALLSAAEMHAHQLGYDGLIVMSQEAKTLQSQDGYRAVHPFRRKHAWRRLNAYRQSSLVLLGSGNLIGAIPYDQQMKWLRPLVDAQKKGIATGLYAIGADRIPTGKTAQLLRDVLSKCVLITVRDPDSVKILESLNLSCRISLVGDPAFLLGESVSGDDVVQSDSSRMTNEIVVSLNGGNPPAMYSASEDVQARSKKVIAATFDRLSRELNARFTFVPFRTAENDDDSASLAEIAEIMNERSAVQLLDGKPSVRQYLELARNARLVVGSRLHSLILANAVNTPTVAIAYAPKVTSYMAYSDQSRYCFNKYELREDRLFEAIRDVAQDDSGSTRVAELARQMRMRIRNGMSDFESHIR